MNDKKVDSQTIHQQIIENNNLITDVYSYIFIHDHYLTSTT